MAFIRGFVLVSLLQLRAETLIREDFTGPPANWKTFGNTNQFAWQPREGRLAVEWDSSKPNSYFYLPLPFTLDEADSFEMSFSLQLTDLAAGTTPGKPYTFELATGLMNLAEATRTNFLRGSGVNASVGPRDLVEFNYFPDTGFGATISPTVVAAGNQIYFSDNHPFELVAGVVYRVQMAYDAEQRTLRTEMTSNGAPFPEGTALRLLNLPPGRTFSVTAFAVESYSDAGQNPPQYSGSLQAHGYIDSVELRLPDPPIQKLSVKYDAGSAVASFVARTNWSYRLDKAESLPNWQEVQGAVPATNGPMSLTDDKALGAAGLYRVRAVKPGL